MRLGEFLFTVLILLAMLALIGFVDWSTVGSWGLFMLILALAGPTLLITFYLVAKLKESTRIKEFGKKLGTLFNWVIVISALMFFGLIILSQKGVDPFDIQKGASNNITQKEKNRSSIGTGGIQEDETLERQQKDYQSSDEEVLKSHKEILSEIFYLDLNDPQDRQKFDDIISNDQKYMFYKRFPDINNDGKNDLIIENLSIGYSGTGGYETYIFVKKDGNYHLLQSFRGNTIEVQSKSTNNFKDLIFEHKKYLEEGGSKYVKDYLEWNGEKYLASPKNKKEEQSLEPYSDTHKMILSEIFDLDLTKSNDMRLYRSITSGDSNKYKLKKRFVDVNNDQNEDLLIENRTWPKNSSDTFTTYIFINNSGNYNFLQKFYGGKVEVKNSSSLNFKNLEIINKKYVKNELRKVKDTLKWNGHEYIISIHK